MRKKSSKNPIPATGTLPKLAIAFPAEIVRRRDALSSVQKIAFKNPDLKKQIEDLGGLNRIIESESSVKDRISFFNTLANTQGAAFVDQLAGGDISTVPKVQDMAVEIGETKGIATAIATAQLECCQELRKLLEELDTLVREQGNSTRLCVNVRLDELLLYVQKRFLEIQTALGNLPTELQPIFDALGEQIEKKLIDELVALQKKLLDELEALRDQLKTAKEEILKSLTDNFKSVESTLKKVEVLLVGIVATLEVLETSIAGVLTAIEILGFNLSRVIVKEHEITRGTVINQGDQTRRKITELQIELEKELKELPKQLKKDFEQFQKEVKEQLEEYKTELEKEFKEKIKKLALDVATEVSLLIVGESYLKWDSTSSYFPTLIFVFNEIVSGGTPRRSQIKTRLKKRSEELTADDLEILRTRLLDYADLSYMYGGCRANYVSSDKRWRTSVFTENKEVAKALYTELGKILEEPVDFDLLSFTTSVKRRPRITIRETPIGDIDLNPITYDAVFPLKLRRAVLLLNNAEKPIELFRNSWSPVKKV